MIYTVTVDHQEPMSEYFHWLLLFPGPSLFIDIELSWSQEFGNSLTLLTLASYHEWSATKFPPKQVLEVQDSQSMQRLPLSQIASDALKQQYGITLRNKIHPPTSMRAIQLTKGRSLISILQKWVLDYVKFFMQSSVTKENDIPGPNYSQMRRFANISTGKNKTKQNPKPNKQK